MKKYIWILIALAGGFYIGSSCNRMEVNARANTVDIYGKEVGYEVVTIDSVKVAVFKYHDKISAVKL